MNKILVLLVLVSSFVYSQVVPIADLRMNDANGVPVDTGQVFTISGIVTCSDQFGSPSAVQDETAGISIFGTNFTNQVALGDSVTVTSVLTQFNGLTEFDFRRPGSSVTIHSNTEIPEPTILIINDIATQQWNGFEEYEGLLIRINNVTINASGNFTSGTNYNITDATGTLAAGLRIDNNVSTIIGTPIPSGQVDIIGILGQYNNPPNTPPFDDGYQVQPRFIQDIVYDGAPLILTPVYASDIDTNSFTVYFNTARNGNSQVKYGLTPSLELDSVVIDTDTTEHVVPVTGLQPFTLYYFKAYSTNNVGTSASDLYSVRTASANPSPGTINVYFNFSVDTTVAIPGNSATGNVDFKNKLIERINQTNYSIDLALYSFFGMPEVADALVLAKNRGVKVRVVYDHRGGGSLQNSMQTLANAGILISRRPNETSTFHGIMHNKFFIFDARDTIETNDWVWTGSWNVTSTELGWKNNVLEINDPTLASAYMIEFEEMWGSNTEIPNPSNAKFGFNKIDNTPHNFNIDGKEIQLYFSPSDGTTNKINTQISFANNNIYLALYVITRDDIRDAIIAQTNLGMDNLRGIVEQTNSQGTEFFTLQTYGEMLENPSPTLHHKYAIMDASYSESAPTTITGSHNWSTAAEEDNDENTVIIRDVYIANQYMQEFKKRYNEAGGTGTFIIPVVGVEDDYEINEFSYQLYQNYPNPFNPVTTIRFEIPYPEYVELTLYDILGRKVRTLFEGEVPAGIISVDFSAKGGSASGGNADGLASGVYIYRLQAGDFIASKKLMLMK
ncbi:MAG: phospholipase D-like domain-containing protein [Ignavibacteria bacterium]|nr:phospholipase D-like domain-containing protein [Ignavibacteria bacterium]